MLLYNDPTVNFYALLMHYDVLLLHSKNSFTKLYNNVAFFNNLEDSWFFCFCFGVKQLKSQEDGKSKLGN